MYESYWQLRQKPFENTADPQFYFPGESHQAALLKLRYAVENRRGGALLAGAAGTRQDAPGRHAPHHARREPTRRSSTWSIRRCPRPNCWPTWPMSWTAGATSAGGAVHESIRRIERGLAENAGQGRHAVVVVDEAHLLESSQTLETLRMLLNFGPTARRA